MIQKNKKGVMHISIVIFVIAVLILTMTSLVVFNIKKNNVDSKIVSDVGTQKIYAQSEIIGFYLREISSNANSIDSFRESFNKLKNSDGGYIISEFSQIAGMLDSSHITIAGNEIKISLDVPLTESSDLYQVDYLYKFRYERVLA